MGFSERVKSELTHVIPQERCCILAELSAFYDFNGYLMGGGRYLDISHSSPLITRRIKNLIKKAYPTIETRLLVQRAKIRRDQIFTIRIPTEESAQLVYQAITKQKNCNHSQKGLAKQCCQRSYVRGAFLSHGSVTNPERNYHLEIFTDKSEIANRVKLTICSLGINARMTSRKNNMLVYIKDGEQIATLLNLIGAHTALLEFENVRVLKDMRNQINRLVNCETANVDKTISAAIMQIEIIRHIQSHMSLSKLPPKLYEIARLRIENPYATLKELGEMVTPQISKSGVNYRLQQLAKLSKQLG